VTHYYYGITTDGDVRVWACARLGDFPRYIWSERHEDLYAAREAARKAAAEQPGSVAAMAPFCPRGVGAPR